LVNRIDSARLALSPFGRLVGLTVTKKRRKVGRSVL
jgi:hypothetical protein